MRSFILGFFALVAASSAVAAERALPFPDRGVSRDPYHNVEGYSTGAFENFRRLYVDPAVAVTSLKPKEAGDKPSADLVVENPTSAWAVVTVSGLKVGQIGPLRTAVMHGVPSGTYEVSFELPNQRKFTEALATR
jgi:hypothetical protein